MWNIKLMLSSYNCCSIKKNLGKGKKLTELIKLKWKPKANNITFNSNKIYDLWWKRVLWHKFPIEYKWCTFFFALNMTFIVTKKKKRCSWCCCCSVHLHILLLDGQRCGAMCSFFLFVQFYGLKWCVCVIFMSKMQTLPLLNEILANLPMDFYEWKNNVWTFSFVYSNEIRMHLYHIQAECDDKIPRFFFLSVCFWPLFVLKNFFYVSFNHLFFCSV